MILSPAIDAATELVDICSILPMPNDQPELIFQNQFVSILHARLKPGQRLNFADLKSRLIVVLSGRARLFGPAGSFVLQENGCWPLGRDEQWDVRAQVEARLILYVVR